MFFEDIVCDEKTEILISLSCGKYKDICLIFKLGDKIGNYPDFCTCKLSFQFDYRWYHTHHWYHVAKISRTAFLKSGRTRMVWTNLSKHLASVEGYIVEWNNLHDTCCFNRKISFCLFVDETQDCKHLMSLQYCFSHISNKIS